MPIGTCWVTTSWGDANWADGSWAGAAPPGCDYPAESDVKLGVVYAFGTMTGTFAGTICDYPSEDDVRDGVDYDNGALTGNLELPDEDDVLAGVGYGSGGNEFSGSLDCLAPPSPHPPNFGMSPFAAIASSVVDRLSVVLGVSRAFIRPVANAHYKVTETEPFFVYVQFFTPQQPRDPALDFTNSGAGRLSRPVGRRIRCYIYTRSGEDVYGGDEIALFGTNPSAVFSDTPTTPGHFLREEQVTNALDDWTPLSASNTPLTIGPLHILDASEEPERPAENDAGLIRSCLDFEVVYNICIDPTEPPS